MIIKTVEMENFNNYKDPCMFIGTNTCNWKCCNDLHVSNEMCQNHECALSESKQIDDDKLVDSYISNPYSNAVVFGGLEPFDQYEELYNCISSFRKKTEDPIIIYSGYYKDEINDKVEGLKSFDNIIVKFGRFIPNQKNRYDDVLGVTLASDNQYAEKIS